MHKVESKSIKSTTNRYSSRINTLRITANTRTRFMYFVTFAVCFNLRSLSSSLISGIYTLHYNAYKAKETFRQFVNNK